MILPQFKKINFKSYKPGKSQLSRIKNITKLSANESALGSSSKVRKIVNSKINLSKYPDNKSTKLRLEISKKFRCEFEQIICGAGSDEIIQIICQLFLKPKDEVIVPQYSFLMYRIYSKIAGANVLFAKENNPRTFRNSSAVMSFRALFAAFHSDHSYFALIMLLGHSSTPDLHCSPFRALEAEDKGQRTTSSTGAAIQLPSPGESLRFIAYNGTVSMISPADTLRVVKAPLLPSAIIMACLAEQELSELSPFKQIP